MKKTEKLPMRTPSLADENLATLAKLFPNAITEAIDEKGAVVRAVDADVLEQEINTHVVSGKEERYQFTWPDKKKSMLLANAPIAATLRPCREESVDFDNTENLYIEGDNLEVLKLLRETYLNKVKMIYIDPPYNTGNDRLYEDDYAEETGKFRLRDGQYDKNGNRLIKNLDSNGRFHTDWLNMIYPRLRVARDLLANDGVIFVSIDDGEVDNLRKICDEIFGSTNFLGQTVRVSSPTQNIANFISIMHDYTLVYCKNKTYTDGAWQVKKNNADEFEQRANKLRNQGLNALTIEKELRELVKYPRFYDFDHYTQCDSRGVFQLVSMGGVDKGNTTTQIYHPVTKKACFMPQGGWRYREDAIKELIARDEIYYGNDETYIPRKKLYLQDYLYQIPRGINFFDTQGDVRFLKDNDLPFDFPKPRKYIKYFVEMIRNKEDMIVLDFFSGSATTAHAVMQLNAEDDGNRSFIMVQIEELTYEGKKINYIDQHVNERERYVIDNATGYPVVIKESEARKAGYYHITQIGKERIRRAGEKIKKENPSITQDLDVGFRVLKLDSTNMKDVYYTPEEYAQMNYTIEGFADNIKPDRTDEDLLFQVMLDLGVPLSAKIRQEDGVFYVEENYLIACFGKVDTDLITEIAKKKPYYAVFRDSSIADDSAMVNFEQIFATYSPGTTRKVL